MPSPTNRGLANPSGFLDAASIALANQLCTEVFPISPLILNPFTDPMPVPHVEQLRPVLAGPEVGPRDDVRLDDHPVVLAA